MNNYEAQLMDEYKDEIRELSQENRGFQGRIDDMQEEIENLEKYVEELEEKLEYRLNWVIFNNIFEYVQEVRFKDGTIYKGNDLQEMEEFFKNNVNCVKIVLGGGK